MNDPSIVLSLPPCQFQALGEVSGRLMEAAAQLEQALELLESAGWCQDIEVLRGAVAAVDSVMVDVALHTGCEPVREVIRGD